MAFLIFYSIVFILYGSINYYLYVRGFQAIPMGHVLKTVFPWLFWGLVLSFVAGRIMERYYLSYLSDSLVWVGSFWLAAMFYFLLFTLLIDLFRLIHYFLPASWLGDVFSAPIVRWRLLQGITIFVALLLFLGFLNARNPVVRKLELTVDKPGNGRSQLTAVLLSDIHLGTLIGNGYFYRIVKQVNALNPEIILLAGDVLDEDLQPVLRQNTGETLRLLDAPLGVWAVMGNHEYIGGAGPAYEYLSQHGLKILRDSAVVIDNSFYLVGREDRDKPRFAGRQRMDLDVLLQQVDKSLPVILLDHQPYYPEQAANLGVDVQFSGHTHHGQLWPLNFITRSVFSLSRGYGLFGKMHLYVSNGVGTWGPPVRIGNRPEIVYVTITFREKPRTRVNR